MLFNTLLARDSHTRSLLTLHSTTISYEGMGIGSCYLFRLGQDAIVDATRTGTLSRFINHSCSVSAAGHAARLD